MNNIKSAVGVISLGLLLSACGGGGGGGTPSSTANSSSVAPSSATVSSASVVASSSSSSSEVVSDSSTSLSSTSGALSSVSSSHSSGDAASSSSNIGFISSSSVAADGIQTLIIGQPETDIASASDSSIFYRFTVEPGTAYMQVRSYGGTGDTDIYVNFGEKPVEFDADCESTNEANDEYCEIENPEPGTWYVQMLVYNAIEGAAVLATTSDVSCYPYGANLGCPGYVAPDPLFGMNITSTISIPRGNSAQVDVTIGRSEQLGNATVTLSLEELPYGVFLSKGDVFLDNGQLSSSLTLTAQSDMPDGIFTAKVRATALGAPDVVSEFSIVPERMARDPETIEECEAHWLPFLNEIYETADWIDGWQVVAMSKDGEPIDFPNDVYKEWMISFDIQKIDERFLRLAGVRERIIHGAEKSDLDFDMKSTNEYLFTPNMQVYASGGCSIFEGIDSMFPSQVGWRSMDLISYGKFEATQNDEIVIQTYGTELTYAKPVYELTLKRVKMPAFSSDVAE